MSNDSRRDLPLTVILQKLKTMKSLKTSTFMRRVQGLKKKTSELATLCGVDAFMISYGSDQSAIPQTWPENPDEVRRVIKSYQLLQENPKKRRRQKPVAECTQNEKRRKISHAQDDDYLLDSFSSDQLQELLMVIDSKLETVNE
ncbi:agamous-like MADS-box protein AGL49 [Telopea speciosissima]|uniref:agamous-like MADS-box protein AGL49 n=1 Tax=Telopea speciosissima TaxID=54955 RepID=UPI001CC7BAD2|nr:agamous-like MADS-box protein AGL49 [Telopea speciosissima]